MSRLKGTKNKPKTQPQLEEKPRRQTMTKLDKEVSDLGVIISIFNSWTSEQKQRNIKYLCAKFYDFL